MAQELSGKSCCIAPVVVAIVTAFLMPPFAFQCSFSFGCCCCCCFGDVAIVLVVAIVVVRHHCLLHVCGCSWCSPVAVVMLCHSRCTVVILVVSAVVVFSSLLPCAESHANRLRCAPCASSGKSTRSRTSSTAGSDPCWRPLGQGQRNGVVYGNTSLNFLRPTSSHL